MPYAARVPAGVSFTTPNFQMHETMMMDNLDNLSSRFAQPVARAKMHDDFDGETKYQGERELEKKKERKRERESAPDALWGNSKNRQRRAANFAQLCMTASVKHAI